MSAVTKTLDAVRKALDSPKLRSCGALVLENGNHCIVGQVLSDAGVTDLELAESQFSFEEDTCRPSLRTTARELGFDVPTLVKAMRSHDAGDMDTILIMVGSEAA